MYTALTSISYFTNYGFLCSSVEERNKMITYTDFQLFQCIQFEKLFQLLHLCYEDIANALLPVFNCSCISKKKAFVIFFCYYDIGYISIEYISTLIDQIL